MSKTAIIIKLTPSEAVVMTRDFEFHSLKKNSDMFLGQQIHFDKPSTQSAIRKHSKYISMAAGVAAVFLLLFAYFALIPADKAGSTYAYIAVDINPSLEFSINHENSVNKVTPLNEDAKNLLRDLDLEDIPVSDALSLIIDKSKEVGLITSTAPSTVLVSASLDDQYETGSSKDTPEEGILDQLLISLDQTFSKQQKELLEMKMIKVPSHTRQKALENDLSMGRYVIYSQLRDAGIDITVQDLEKRNIGELVSKVNIEHYVVHSGEGTVPTLSPTGSKFSSIPRATPVVATETPGLTDTPKMTPLDTASRPATPANQPSLEPTAKVVPTVVPVPDPTPNEPLVSDPTPKVTPIVKPTAKQAFTIRPTSEATPNATPTAKPTPAILNRSLGRDVYCSSYNTDRLPQFAVDGLPDNTYWAAPSTTDQWLYVDLHQDYKIHSVKIKFSTYNYPTKYLLKRWDGKNWITIANLKGSGGWNHIKFKTPFETRWFKVYCYENNDDYYTIYELEVYGEDP